MKISKIFLFCSFASLLYSQVQTVSYETNGITVSMESIDSIYNKNDTVLVRIKLFNSSKDTFFVSSHTFDEQLTINNQKGYIDYDFGGTFYPEFGLTFKLDVFMPDENIEFLLRLTWKDIQITKHVEVYCLNMWFGIFNYSDSLLYLTMPTGGLELTQIKEKDILPMFGHYRNFVVGCLPIRLKGYDQ